jgi:hypothetical protein
MHVRLHRARGDVSAEAVEAEAIHRTAYSR